MTTQKVLLLDFVTCCADCPCSHLSDGKWWCYVPMDAPAEIEKDVFEVIPPNWCPLKPLPSKDFWHKKDYADGWNACLEEILGEAK